MRHVAVRRVTLLLGAGLVLYAAAFAWFVRDAPEPTTTPEQSIGGEPSVPDGRLLFQRHCAACHDAGDLAAQMQEGGPNARSTAETFLRDHGDAADEDDRLILDYLSGPDVR